MLALSGQLAEHLVEQRGGTRRGAYRKLEKLVHTLPPGPRQSAVATNKDLLSILRTQARTSCDAPAGPATTADTASAWKKRPGFRGPDVTGGAVGRRAPRGCRSLERARGSGWCCWTRVPGTGSCAAKPCCSPRCSAPVIRSRYPSSASEAPELSVTAVGDPMAIHLRLARSLGRQPAALHHRFPGRSGGYSRRRVLPLLTSWRNPPRGARSGEYGRATTARCGPSRRWRHRRTRSAAKTGARNRVRSHSRSPIRSPANAAGSPNGSPREWTSARAAERRRRPRPRC